MTNFARPLRPAHAVVPDFGRPGSRRRLVLAMAMFTTLVETLSVGGLLPSVEIGGLSLSLALIPALALGVACGDRLLGRSSFRRIAAGYWIVSGLALLVLAGFYIHLGRVPLYGALIAAALGEELVYRLAVPAVVAVALQYGGVRPDRARIAGLTMAGLWFVLLPGHQSQMLTPSGAIPFIAFAALSAVLVHHSGSVLPMALAHAVTNLVTILVWEDALPTDARGMGLAALLGLLVLAYGRPRRLTLDHDRGMIDTITGLAVAEFDVRPGQPPSAVLSDGSEIILGTPVPDVAATVEETGQADTTNKADSTNTAKKRTQPG